MELSSEERPESTSCDPRTAYTRECNSARTELARLERLENLVGNGRVVVFLAGVVVGYLIVGAGVLAPYWVAFPAILLFLLVLWHERVQWAVTHAGGVISYYEKGIARLDGHWQGAGEAGTRYLVEGHPYALDLDILGGGSVFERLSTARTRAGEQTLASWLLAPATPDEVRQRQEALGDLRDRLGLREEIALLGSGIPGGVDLEGLVQWASAATILPWSWGRIVAPIIVSLTLATLIGLLSGELTSRPCLFMLTVQSAFALWLSKRVQSVTGPIDRRARDLALFAGLLARIERESFTAHRFLAFRESLSLETLSPSRRIARLMRLVYWLNNTHNVYFALISPLVLYTTQLAFAFEAWRANVGQAVSRWLEVVGEFEALCSLAAYSYENPDDPFPEVTSTGPCFEGEGLGHPLLAADRCVRNDVKLGADLRLLVVSGSNMSGKSTLLRTVGINAVLALAGAPVRARQLRLSPLAVGAILHIQDSLQEGRSRFFTEITRIRQLVDLARGPIPLLFLLDEILHGTNSHDRRQGAEAIVRSLVDLGAIGLITTHDLALTQIAEQLAPRAINVHFTDRFENGAITFDYRMNPGVVHHSNAIALMRAVGLDV